MADNYGISFSPLENPQFNNQGGRPGAPGAANPIQQAIRTLSYRTPRTVGAPSPIPNALLQSAGGANVPQSTPWTPQTAPTPLPTASAPPAPPAQPSPVAPPFAGPTTTPDTPAPEFGFEALLRRLFGLPEATASPAAGWMPPPPSMTAPPPQQSKVPSPSFIPGIGDNPITTGEPTPGSFNPQPEAPPSLPPTPPGSPYANTLYKWDPGVRFNE